jgi:hypothetical protein
VIGRGWRGAVVRKESILTEFPAEFGARRSWSRDGVCGVDVAIAISEGERPQHDIL